MTPRVLITRDELRARALIDRLAAHDISGVAVAMTEIEIIITSTEIPDLTEFHWIAFTSTNAVDVFAKLIDPSQRQIVAGKRIAVVGSATARAVERKLHMKATLTGAANGATLSEGVLKTVDNPEDTRVLWPCAESTVGGFLESLTSTGLKVNRLPIYRTITRNVEDLKHDLHNARPWNLIFFAAPSQVKVFADTIPEAKDTPCVAIGSTTATELHRLDFTDVAVCRSTELAEIERCIVNTLN